MEGFLQDHFGILTNQIKSLRKNIEVLEQESGAGRHLRGQQTVDDQQAIHQAFDELDEAITHVSDVLVALAEALSQVPKL